MLFVEIITNFVPKKHLIVKKANSSLFSNQELVLWLRWLHVFLGNGRHCFCLWVFVKNGNIVALGVKNATFFELLNTAHVVFAYFCKDFKK